MHPAMRCTDWNGARMLTPIPGCRSDPPTETIPPVSAVSVPPESVATEAQCA